MSLLGNRVFVEVIKVRIEMITLDWGGSKFNDCVLIIAGKGQTETPRKRAREARAEIGVKRLEWLVVTGQGVPGAPRS